MRLRFCPPPKPEWRLEFLPPLSDSFELSGRTLDDIDAMIAEMIEKTGRPPAGIYIGRNLFDRLRDDEMYQAQLAFEKDRYGLGGFPHHNHYQRYTEKDAA